MSAGMSTADQTMVYKLLPVRPGAHWGLVPDRGEVVVRARSSGEARAIAARAEAEVVAKERQTAGRVSASAFPNPALYTVRLESKSEFPANGEPAVLTAWYAPGSPEDP